MAKKVNVGFVAEEDSRDAAELEFESILDKELNKKEKAPTTGSVEFDLTSLGSVDTLEYMNEEEREEYDSKMRQKAAMERMYKFVNKQIAAFTRNFVDYGPPYDTENEVGGLNLVVLSAQIPVKLFDIHMLLNDRVDPNTRDPEDLHYAAIHWCARNYSVMALKMLRRAKADINITNELGQTALMFCLIVKQKDRRAAQLKTVRYLLEEGADVNMRDKAGYGAIDYAAIAQDFESLEMLVAAGAVVIRENTRFVAPRKETLSLVTDPDCYRVVYQQWEKEMAVINAVKEAEDQRKKLAAEAERVRKLHRDLAKKRDNRIAISKTALVHSKQQAVRNQRNEKLSKEVEDEKAKIAEQKLRFGEWRKGEAGRWGWEAKAANAPKEFGEIYTRAKREMRALRDEYSLAKFDARWNKLTGQHLEVDWRQGDQFDVDGLEDESSRKGAESKAGDVIEALAYRDENDDELEGEELGDLMSALTTKTRK